MLTNHAVEHAPIPQSAKDQLRSFIERIERLEEEKAGLASDIRDLFDEAAGSGFDKKALKAVIKARKQDAAERAQLEGITATYMHALGMADA